MNSPLNDVQVSVLHWIAEGCDTNSLPSPTYKTSAVALQNRGLIYLDRRWGHWKATLTDKGRYYVQHGRYPDPPAKPVKTEPRPTMGSATPATRATKKPSPPKPVPKSETQASSKPKPTVVKTPDIPVPDQIRDPHPAIQQLLKHQGRLGIPKEHQHRALLILNALVEEAVRRGWTVVPARKPDPGESAYSVRSRMWQRSDPFSIDAGNSEQPIRLRMQQRRVTTWPTEKEHAEAKRWGYTARPRNDLVFTDNMILEVGTEYFNRLAVGDTAVLKIEDKLARVFNRIQKETDKAIVLAEERRIAAIVAAEAHERAEALRARRERYSEWAMALETLNDEVQHHSDLTQTIDALQRFISDNTDQERIQEVREFVAWAEGHLEQSDPLLKLALPTGERPDLTYSEWRTWKEQQDRPPSWQRY